MAVIWQAYDGEETEDEGTCPDCMYVECRCDLEELRDR